MGAPGRGGAIAERAEVEAFGRELNDGDPSKYYEIPRKAKTVKQTRANRALFYNFLHVPKTGGTFFHSSVATGGTQGES